MKKKILKKKTVINNIPKKVINIFIYKLTVHFVIHESFMFYLFIYLLYFLLYCFFLFMSINK